MTSQICRILRGRGHFSRRSKPALCVLTILSLSQAWPLGGLHRAAPVPFRGSSFTSGLHPLDATPQRLIAYLYRQRDFPSITFLRFVAHIQVMLSSDLCYSWPEPKLGEGGRSEHDDYERSVSPMWIHVV